MTQSYQGHAKTSFQPSQPPKMEAVRVQSEARENKTVSKSIESGTIASIDASQQRKNKQSLDYVMRTGLAGGLAGCVVWLSALNSCMILIVS